MNNSPPRGGLIEELSKGARVNRGSSEGNPLHAISRDRMWENDFSEQYLVPGSGSLYGLSCISPKFAC